MSAHTTGPWEAHTSRYLKFATVVIADAAHEIRSEHSEADARLIAAAPDLLAALQEVMTMDGSEVLTWDEADAIHARARAAIAKATGSAA